MNMENNMGIESTKIDGAVESIASLREQIKQAEKERNGPKVMELETTLRRLEVEKKQKDEAVRQAAKNAAGEKLANARLVNDKARTGLNAEGNEAERAMLINDKKEQTERVKKVENSDGKDYVVKMRGEEEPPAGQAYKEELAKLRVMETKKAALDEAVRPRREKVAADKNAFRVAAEETARLEKERLAYEETRQAKFLELKRLEGDVKEQTERVKKVENSDGKDYVVKMRGEEEPPAGQAYKEELAKLRVMEVGKKALENSIEEKWKRSYEEQRAFEEEKGTQAAETERQRAEAERAANEAKKADHASLTAEIDALHNEANREKAQRENELNILDSEFIVASETRDYEEQREAGRLRNIEKSKAIEADLIKTREEYAEALVEFKLAEFNKLNWVQKKIHKINFAEPVNEIYKRNTRGLEIFTSRLSVAEQVYDRAKGRKSYYQGLGVQDDAKFESDEYIALSRAILRLIPDDKDKARAAEDFHVRE